MALGEQLTERQLLEGLLVHSANNFADALAAWDAGSLPAFVDKMNTTAAILGMTGTHFADPSGLDATSESTPADLLRLARWDLASPTFAQIADLPDGRPARSPGYWVTFTPSSARRASSG